MNKNLSLNQDIYLDGNIRQHSTAIDQKLFFSLKYLGFKDRYEIAALSESGPMWSRNFPIELSNLNYLLSLGLVPFSNLADVVRSRRRNGNSYFQLNRPLNFYLFNRVGGEEPFQIRDPNVPKTSLGSSLKNSDFLIKSLNDEFEMHPAVEKNLFMTPTASSTPLMHWKPVYSVSIQSGSSKLKSNIIKFMVYAFDNSSKIRGNASLSKTIENTLHTMTRSKVGLSLETLCDCIQLYRKLKSKLTYSSVEFDRLIAELSSMLSVPPAQLNEQVSQYVNKNKFNLFDFDSEIPKQTTIIANDDAYEPFKGLLRQKVQVSNSMLLDSLNLMNPERLYLELANSQMLYVLNNDSALKQAVELMLKDHKIAYSKNVVDFPIVYDFVVTQGSKQLVIMVMDDAKVFLNMPSLQLPKVKYDLAVMEAEQTPYIVVYPEDLLNPMNLLQKISNN